MGFLVFRHVALCDRIKSASVEKLLFFFLLRTCFQSHFYGLHYFSPNPFDWGWYGGVLFGLRPIFSNHNLRTSSHCIVRYQSFWYVVSGKYDPQDTRITSGQPEKESIRINKSPTPVMYAWSIWTRLHGSTSMVHECKVVCVKFLNPLRFLYLFIYSLRFRDNSRHHASNFIFFV